MDGEQQQNLTPFKWNKKKVDASQLLAEDELTDEEISKKVGCTRQTLWTWKKHPEFSAKVAELVREIGDAARRYAVGKRARRVRWLNDRVARLHRVIRDRAADPAMQDVPGGTTGLLVRTIKGIGGGPNFKEVEEYAVDTGLLRELREHEAQAAQELGQAVTKIAPTTPDGNRPYESTVGLGALIAELRAALDEPTAAGGAAVAPGGGGDAGG